MNNNPIDLYVGSRRYTIVNKDDRGAALAVANEVNSRLDKLKENPKLDMLDRALLTACDLCEDKIAAEEGVKKYEAEHKTLQAEAAALGVENLRLKAELEKAAAEIKALQEEKASLIRVNVGLAEPVTGDVQLSLISPEPSASARQRSAPSTPNRSRGGKAK